MKKCKLCNKEFETDNNIKIYCSKECQKKMWKRKSKEKGHYYSRRTKLRFQNCKLCGKEFQARGKKMYCSRKCQKKDYNFYKKNKLKRFKYTMKQLWKDKDKDFLIKRYKQAIIKMGIIEEIMFKRGEKIE